MPIETTVTLCGNCGAALERRAAEAALQCAYCRQTTYLAPTSTPEPPDPPDPPEAVAPEAGAAIPLHQRLLRGPTGEAQGVGVRYSPSQMATRDVPAVERGLWPVGAHASSTFGGSWSPSALLGPARVYPRCGDIGGAWAPAPRKSPVEWVELQYAAEVPVSAVRVFETNRPGSTFAVVDVTHGEQLLYEGAPRSDGTAQVLEVAVTPPRVVRRLRVYVVNPGWAEIDTVGLLSAAPLPEALRTRPAAPSRGGGGGVSLALGVALIVIAFVVAVATRGRAPARVAAPTTPLRARPTVLVAGATVRHLTLPPEAFAVRGVAWASEVAGFSSEFSAITNAAAGVRGAPDVYPQYGDIDGAWASLTTDAGEEWIEVRFEAPVTTTKVLWVETFNPGAVTRVDDVSDPGAPAVLWEGASPPQPAASAVAELTLPAPRTIRALRLVLDSPRVPGWNEIDAIGLARSP
jgi:hypothetical protein